jgi:hypothetical protein
MSRVWARRVSNLRPLACEAWRSWGLWAPKCLQIPNQSRREMPGVGPGTARYGRVWPNEWPNGEIRARAQDGAPRARVGRDRSRPHRDGDSPNRHYMTGTTGGALSEELDASCPRWIPAAHDRRTLSTLTWPTSASRRAASLPVPGAQGPAALGRALAHVVVRQRDGLGGCPRDRCLRRGAAVSPCAPARRPRRQHGGGRTRPLPHETSTNRGHGCRVFGALG